MAGEGDQTKWVGIRPTNPAENIPVTESAPLTDILVAPSAGGPLFLTETEKRAPAIGDLQAISGFVRATETVLNVGAGAYAHSIYTVPAGKMLMLSYCQASCAQVDPTEVQFTLFDSVRHYVWSQDAYGAAGTIIRKFPNILYDETEVVTFFWVGTLAGSDVTGYVFGHLMDKY